MADLLHRDTRVIHDGELADRIEGAVNVPIFHSTVFEFDGRATYHGITYPRLNNLPNHRALAAKLAALEGAEAAVVAASGMAAISTTLLALVGRGDHILVGDGLYGGTYSFVTQDLPRWGVEHDVVDPDDPADWERKRRPTTKAIYVETISNPLMRVPDLDGVVAFARSHGLVSIVDNTFATPINFRPGERGFDLSLHSGTKYLGGHSDVAAGAVIGRAALVERVHHQLNHLGGTLGPQSCFLLQRGIKTLALRVERQNRNALAVAEALEALGAVRRVSYPGLASHPQHERARELLAGFGGMIAFELRGGATAAQTVVSQTRLFLRAPSLGGVESLITQPRLTSHSGMSAAERARLGISDGLIRLSVGIEYPDDLIADLTQAIAAISGSQSEDE